MLEEMLSYDIEFKNIHVLKTVFDKNAITDYTNFGREKYLLHYVISGTREYIIDDKTYIIEKGAVIFIPDKTKYITTTKKSFEDCSGIGIAFDIDGIPDNLIKKDIYYKYEDIIYDDNNVFTLIEKVYNRIPVQHFKLKTLLYYLFLRLINLDPTYSVIKPAIDFIVEHYNKNLPVKSYADTCNLSESHFRKLFLQHIGISPIEFRNRIRFREAKKLYQQNLTLNEIAEKTGFCDANYFSKLYKRYTNSNIKEISKFI